ncbi:MAG: FeoB small GTPase domain-containing protein [Eubacteriales bacterium]
MHSLPIDHSIILRNLFGITPKQNQAVIALAGNPNVGKSTLFNALTGLRQHTGNWPGKTVDNAQGAFTYKDKSFLLIDLPGTYSILAHTVEEEIARDFICFGKPNVTLVVLDATSMERNLNLALQVMEITSNIVVCVNLIDEAKKQNIIVDTTLLENELGVPVIATSARNKTGLKELCETLYLVARGKLITQPKNITYSEEIENAVNILLPKIEQLNIGCILNPRWVALRLLDGDKKIISNICRYLDLQPSKYYEREVEITL